MVHWWYRKFYTILEEYKVIYLTKHTVKSHAAVILFVNEAKKHTSSLFWFFVSEFPSLKMFLICTYFLPIIFRLFLKVSSYIKSVPPEKIRKLQALCFQKCIERNKCQKMGWALDIKRNFHNKEILNLVIPGGNKKVIRT